MNLSGYNLDVSLSKSLDHRRLDSEYIESFGYIPTSEDQCPYCKTYNKWRTTGFIPPYLTCDKCGNKFSV